MPVAIILALLLLPVLHADNSKLIRVAESWRYLKGFSEPDPGWMTNDFDDSAWSQSRAGFSNYGGYGEQTIFPDYGQGYTAVYFRKRFMVDDPSRIRELILRLDYDDGCVIYFNGREVARRGLTGSPNVPVSFDAISTPHSRGLTEEMNLTAALGALRAGENLMAVQIVGSGPGDASMSFSPELMANFTRSPYIQNTTTHSTQVAWKTYSRTDGWIEFGTARTNTTVLETDRNEFLHLATLEGLAPDTRYEYRVGARFDGEIVWSEWSFFRSFKAAGPASFAFIADTGWATPQQYQVADQLRKTDVDLIIHGGDLTYSAITEYSTDLRVLSVHSEQLRTTPMFVALGNHDALADINVPLRLFYLPTNSVTGTEHFYSFDHGDVHFVVFWSDLAAGAQYHPGSALYDWLEQDLAATRKPWKILIMHHCWRTSSAHAVDDYDRNGVRDMVQLDEVAALAGRYGVQCIFNGHDHCYERFTPRHGVLSYTSGGGGAALYGFGQPGHPDSVEFHSRFHFLKVDVRDRTASVQAIDEMGRLIEITHFTRDFPEPRVYQAAWHRPSVENGPADDADGNIEGQVFDFAGVPIAAKAGSVTSAGRLFVNNDAENLYLGLDQVMLHAGEEVFLFVELGGSNAGTVDPKSWEWDLEFANFNPAVVAIVGDEFSDTGGGPIPRQGMRLLAPGLPMVAGQRVQQFNRSPQNAPVFHEANANFVEIAVPLSALALKPGGEIRVAARVALALATNQTLRAFDRGGIVPRDGSVEPFTVKLAAGPEPGTTNFWASATARSDGNIEVRWNALAGRWYRVEYLEELGGFFRDLSLAALPRRAELPTERVTIPADPGSKARYYRVVLVPE